MAEPAWRIPTAAELVPGPGQAVVALWSAAAEPTVVRIDGGGPDGGRLVVGRNRGDEPVHGTDGTDQRLALPEGLRFLSRRQLVVAPTEQDWLVEVCRGARNPGRARYWGELAWRRVAAGDRVPLRDGLLAVLLPGRPRVVLTVSGQAPARTGDRTAATAETEAEPASHPLALPPAERQAVVESFGEALHWPPDERDGNPRGWTDHANPATAHARRRSYRRLVERADGDPEFAWQERPAVRGPDPTLLRELVESGSLGYPAVHRQLPQRLVPTQHTHHPDGRPRTARD